MKRLPQGIRRLLSAVAIPGWILVAFHIADRLSTIDFVLSARGNPRLVAAWNFLLSPKGNLLVLVIGFVWLGLVAVGPREVFQKLRGTFATEEAKAIATQLARLNRYQIEAIKQLTLASGMTGEHFYLLVEQFGFPIHSAAAQDQIIETFDRINEVTSLLEVEPSSKVWRVRPEVRGRVAYLLLNTLPVF